MKRIYVALILIAITTLLCISEFRLVTDTGNEFIEEIERIERAYDTDKHKALMLCTKLSKDWEESASPMDAYLFHDYVDDISINTEKLKFLIIDENTSEFRCTCAEIKKQLESLKKSEIPNLENII